MSTADVPADRPPAQSAARAKAGTRTVAWISCVAMALMTSGLVASPRPSPTRAAATTPTCTRKGATSPASTFAP